MNGYNKVILAGNLTRDPELRYTPSGTAIAQAGLAINRRWRDQNGEQKEDVTFVDWKCFGDRAATMAEHLSKGKPVLIEGRLNLEQWEDRQTQQKRSKLVVIVESFSFLPDGQDHSQQQEGQRRERPDTEGATRNYPSAKPRLGGRQAAQGSFAGMPASDDMPPEEDDVPF